MKGHFNHLKALRFTDVTLCIGAYSAYLQPLFLMQIATMP